MVQLGAVTYYGLFPPSLLGPSLILTLVALVAFALGLKVQDRLEPRAFNRAILGFLAALDVWLVAKSAQ